MQAVPSIGPKPVVDVTIGDLRRIVVPHWAGRNSLGYYIRQNLEDLFDWVVGEQLRPDNPAASLKRLLPRVRTARNHRPSLPYAQAPEALAYWEALPLNPAIKLVLPFIVLTAARLREATDATWGEIDLEARRWQVPKERMKADRAHTVPLSDQALDILERARAVRGQSSLIFPLVGRDGKTRPVSQGALSDALAKLGRVDVQGRPITVHGFRSTFRVWTIEVARAKRQVAELALAHGESDQTVASYARDAESFKDRAALMDQWADYILAWSGRFGDS